MTDQNNAPEPMPGDYWTHYNGTPYQVLHIANLPDNPRYPQTVVYQGPNGRVWSRPLSDWHRSMTLTKRADRAAPMDNTALFEAARAWAKLKQESEHRISLGGWDTLDQRLALFEAEEAMHNAALASLEASPGTAECPRCGSHGGFGCYECTPPACQQEAVTVAEAAQVILNTQIHPSSINWQSVWDAMREYAKEGDLPMAFNKALRALKGDNNV